VGTFQDVRECISNVFGSLFPKFNLLVSVKPVANQELCCVQLLIYCAALFGLKLELPVVFTAIG